MKYYDLPPGLIEEKGNHYCVREGETVKTYEKLSSTVSIEHKGYVVDVWKMTHVINSVIIKSDVYEVLYPNWAPHK